MALHRPRTALSVAGERANQAIYTYAPAGFSGFHNAINTAAISDSAAPKQNGAEAPKPPQLPRPCHKIPAINDAGKSKIPSTALYVP